MAINPSTFEKIYDEFAPKIFKFCYFRVSSKEEAEDIASQVFLRAWDHIGTGKEVIHIQGFLYRIANNLIIDFYRKNKGGRELSLDDPAHPIDLADSTEFVGQLEFRMVVREVHALLQKLPDAYREVIVMKYVNDLSIKEIAKALETSENNVSVRIHRAVEKIKTMV